MSSSGMLFAAIVLAPTIAAAGIYDGPQNLEVLPDDISADALRETMRGFALALGTDCTTCHVGDQDQPLESYDFASDEKTPKATARRMLRMVRSINERYIASIDRPDGVEAVIVRCVTCHRGQRRPLLTADALAIAHAEGGVARAVARYAELKAEYYGTHTYDFSESTLTEFAERLASEASPAAGIEFLHQMIASERLSYSAWWTLARLHLQNGDRAAAIAALERGLESAPAQWKPAFVRDLQRLRELQQENL